MRKLILLLLFTMPAMGQNMVLIEGFKTHEPITHDAISEKTVKRYEHYMESNPINYEKDYRKVKEIVMIERDRYFVSDFKNGIIYLNSRLSRFPATKEVVILHHLAENNGMRTYNRTAAHVQNNRFNITEKNEEVFRRQLIRQNPYKYVVKKLKKTSPLRSKL